MSRLSPLEQWALMASVWDRRAAGAEAEHDLEALTEADREAIGSRLMIEIKQNPEDTAGRRERIVGLMEAWA